MTSFKATLISIFIFCSSHIAFAYDPPDGYSDEFNKDIAGALLKNGIRGCGYLVWKSNQNSNGEYLIFCSRDGDSWRPYTVWLPLGKAQAGHYE